MPSADLLKSEPVNDAHSDILPELPDNSAGEEMAWDAELNDWNAFLNDLDAKGYNLASL